MTICLSKVWMLLVTQAAVAFLLLLLSSSFSPCLLRRPFFLLSPSSSWGACAGLPRPYLGWCPSVGVRVLLATSLLLLLSSFFFLLSSFSPCLLRRPFFLLSPSSSWGACAGLPRPYLGWCPSVGVRVLLATSLSPSASSSSFSSSLSCLLLSPSSSWGARAGLPRPDLGWCHSVGVHVLLATSLLLLLFLLLLLLSSFSPCLLRRPFFLLSPSSSWGVCAGLPRPYLWWCPSVGVRVLLATSLPLLLLLLLLLLLVLLCPVSFCLPPLLGVRVLVYHVLTWGGAPVSGCVCCWPRPFLFCFFFFFFFFFFALSSSSSLLVLLSPSSSWVRALVYHVLTWGGVTVSGCMCCWPRPFFFFFFFFFLSSSFSPCLLLCPFFLLSPSSSWGACAGLPRPYLGWCPSVGVRVLLATSLPLLLLLLLLVLLCPVSFCLPPLLGVRVLAYHVLNYLGLCPSVGVRVLLEATLGFGRCLWGLSPGVQCFLTTTFDNWARQLLGAKPWNNAASCQADLDWTFDASDRIAIDIASVRPKLWTLEGAIAGRLFRSSHVSNVPSWASISRQFLASKDILDWPTWVSRRAAETGSYKQYVKHTLKKAASTHLKDSLGLNLPWNVLLSQRAVIQVRRDYVVFGHVNGKKSKASQGPGMHLMSEEVF